LQREAETGAKNPDALCPRQTAGMLEEERKKKIACAPENAQTRAVWEKGN